MRMVCLSRSISASNSVVRRLRVVTSSVRMRVPLVAFSEGARRSSHKNSTRSTDNAQWPDRKTGQGMSYQYGLASQAEDLPRRLPLQILIIRARPCERLRCIRQRKVVLLTLGSVHFSSIYARSTPNGIFHLSIRPNRKPPLFKGLNGLAVYQFRNFNS